jgi:hypothetical protein
MIKVRASCSVSGDNFSPKKVNRNIIKLFGEQEPNSLVEVGIFKGTRSSQGWAFIEVSDKAEESWDCIGALLDLVEKGIDELRKAGSEELSIICSMFHDGQCNFGFSEKELQRIAALGASLSISCYSEDALPD